MSSATLVNKKVTMQTNVLKSQKPTGNLGKLYINKWEKGGKIRANILH